MSHHWIRFYESVLPCVEWTCTRCNSIIFGYDGKHPDDYKSEDQEHIYMLDGTCEEIIVNRVMQD